MNAQLLAYYDSINSELAAALQGFPKVSKPLFCKVPEGYATAPVRLMIVGQETRGWGFPDINSAADLMDFYEKKRHNFGGPISRATKEVYRGVNPSGPERAFLWTNLIKVDQEPTTGRAKTNNRPSSEVEEIVCRFPMLLKEIEITKPSAVVFFVGPRYRSRLVSMFPEMLFETAAPKIFRVKHPLLPVSSFYTYHPGYLARGHWHVISDLIGLIASDHGT